jgi:farnesyl-diphosphate farnesyltransferase
MVCFNTQMRRRTSETWWSLLKEVSRSFYLTLRVLPAPIRPQIALAYILARATDTVADTVLVSVERRLELLRALRTAVQQAAADFEYQPPDFADLAAAQPDPTRGSAAERILLQRVGDALQALKHFAPDDRRRIRDLIDIISSGQELDLTRFADASAERIVALETDSDLNDYTYRVAGCVGEFWTEMCRAHLFPEASLDRAFLGESGVRFGRGLQLVNILRDLPKDLGSGRCYIPAQRLLELGMSPADLVNPGSIGTFRPLYDEYLSRAEELLMAGWFYAKALPNGHVRVRLACAWPVLIGLKTLARLKKVNILDPRSARKVSRSEVRRLILRSIVSYPSAAAWDRLLILARGESNAPNGTGSAV